LVRPTQPVEIFGNVSSPFGTLVLMQLYIFVLTFS